MRKLFMLFAAAVTLVACNQPKQEAVVTEVKATPPTEFADSSYVQTCKKGLMALAAGDVDAFTSGLADNAVYRWNAGDSLSGKAAIVDYWKNRRSNVIDKMEISKDIWLAIKVNESKQVRPGTYAFAWFRVSSTYKGGKSMSQWIHNVYHFDGSGKVDEVTQFIDMAPILAALPPKKK